MINVYEGIKGVKKVKSLSNEDIQNATQLGSLPSGVTVLLTKSHVEFSVALEGKRQQTDDVVWLGFHYSSSFQKFQKLFAKSLQNPSFENIQALLHKTLTTKFEDPYSSPLYITGTNDSKAYWTVSLPDKSIFGHIPLHRSDSFHSLQSYPIIHLEFSDMQVIIGTDLDRNQLFPSYPNIDTLYTQTLRNIDPIFSQHKWSSTVIPSIKSNEDNNQNNNNNNNNSSSSSLQKTFLNKNQFDLEKLSRWFLKKFNPVHPLTFVYGVSFYKKGVTKTIDMMTLKSSTSGKSYIVNLVHTFRLSPQLDYFKDTEAQKSYEIENLPKYIASFSDLERDCQIIKNLIPSTSVSIYNPFFEKHTHRKSNIPSPLTLESTFFNEPVNQNQNNQNNQNQNTHKNQQPKQNRIDDNINIDLLANIIGKSVFDFNQQQFYSHVRHSFFSTTILSSSSPLPTTSSSSSSSLSLSIPYN
ncbi:hypothetical protein DFA_10270 [Cavenderia fasciculata]|uniref:Uncharacterized protein n=1 Tax=Cavenderia fasciculata TaxID=261658 RepID=F4Q9R6_CACFS|nr:uncharacterized protein DFA_10270 [Cavenderia fasciculata]EGG15435.1 hypothetical protein DFA_10270 [Cavenderia fasciculata]|eukprot:XP_004354177.1 hypothetical protein DFA_10270 [Cavenderia fasciculata]